MANEFQESILQAIDTLVTKRIEQLDNDKTITATIDTCVNMVDNVYLVNYQGGKFYAYAQDDTAYTRDQSVYVLVPENDFTKKKIILGKATNATDENESKFVSSLVGDYNVIGSNTLDLKPDATQTVKQFGFGLHSYLAFDIVQVYDVDNPDGNMMTFDVDTFATYIKRADALMIRAQFNTSRLPRAHKTANKGNYGVHVRIRFKDRQDDNKESVKDYDYIFDTSDMSGNPLLYEYYMTQYSVFPLDSENFIRIDGIWLFSEGFVDVDNVSMANEWGEDIFIRNLEILGLEEISAVSGDYKLKLSTPKGAVFKDEHSNTYALDAKAQLLYKETTELTDQASFYWFREDARVDTTSADYSIYGGVGWSHMKEEAGNDRLYQSLKGKNYAYENKYLCTCVYKDQVVLKTYFSFFNNSNRREIRIDALPSTRFSFDRGTVRLTCLVKDISGNDPDADFIEDNINYTYIWSKIEKDGSVITFDKTYDELKAEYDKEKDIRKRMTIKRKMDQMLGVKIDRNKIEYPVKGIETSATFKCTVYRNIETKLYMAGSQTITIQNADAAEPSDYYIVIENGDQVFQYSESGVSPCDERYKDPLEVPQLVCHFYDPAGLEVDQSTYGLKWKVPLADTLIVNPKDITDKDGNRPYKDSMYENPSNQIPGTDPAQYVKEWFQGSYNYPMAIKDNYDYSALDNQVTAIVTYDGVEYTKDTNFLFVKVGDNGTNGTDIVARIVAPDDDNSMAYISTYKDTDTSYAVTWNDGQALSAHPLQGILYQRNQVITDGYEIKWGVSGDTSNGSKYTKNMTVTSDADSMGVVGFTYDDGSDKSRRSHTIAKATFNYDKKSYYAFYGVPIVIWSSKAAHDRYRVVIDKKRTLKDILYNSDGRNPMYNKNQGVAFTLYDNGTPVIDFSKVTWFALGGYNDNDESADFKIIQEKNSKDGRSSINGISADSDVYSIYVLPNDAYTGQFCNNRVVCVIDGICTISVPIHMSLNTFGLASLNNWDGNHVEINEDDNYIMAPQIGAGAKDENNRFTGIVMGTAQTYDEGDPQIGLLGYCKGEKSIWLDAKSGKAIFGLQPYDIYDKNGEYRYTEGRIELIPGGTSKIANWKISADSLYNVFGDRDLGPKYSDLTKEYKRSIPHTASGILLSAEPSYISLKGRELTNADIDTTMGTNIIYPTESFELELNPNATSLFTIYRHTQNDDKWTNEEGNGQLKPTGTWRRVPMVGIDNNGRFYANSVKEEGAAMTLNYLPAFGVRAGLKNGYRGVNVEIGATSEKTVPMIKFFVNNAELSDNDGEHLKDATIYISGGSTLSNEYIRPMSLHGKTISLYASPSASTALITNHRITLAGSMLEAGHYDANDRYNSYLNLNYNTSVDGKILTSLYTSNELDISSKKDYTSTIGGNASVNIGKASSLSVDEDATVSIKGTNTTTINGDTSISVVSASNTAKRFSLTNKTYNLVFDTNTMLLGNTDNHLTHSSSGSNIVELKSSDNLRMWANQGAVELINDSNGGQIYIQAKGTATAGQEGKYEGVPAIGHATISLVPSAAGNQGSINLLTNRGQITVGAKIGDIYGSEVNGVIIPTLGVNRQYISDVFTDTETSLLTKKDIVSQEGKIIADKGDIVIKDGNKHLIIGAKTNMNEAWFNDIQDLLNHWDKSQNNGYFPRPSFDPTSINNALNTKSDKTATPKLSEINECGRLLATALTGITDVAGLVSALSGFATALNSVSSL